MTATPRRWLIDTGSVKVEFSEDGKLHCRTCGYEETVQAGEGESLIQATTDAAQWHTTECYR